MTRESGNGNGSKNGKSKSDKNESNDSTFVKVTPELIEEMVQEYKKSGFVPIIIELTEDEEVELFVSINSMHSGGSAWINGFDINGEFVRINEGYIKKIRYIETTQIHYDEYNKYVEQGIAYHKQNLEFEQQFGIFNERKNKKHAYDGDVQ